MSDNALITVEQLPIIREHLEELKVTIRESTEQALSLVCNEETLATVKDARAGLRKQFDELEEQRKQVKKSILGPYEQFEAIYKDCVSDTFKSADVALKGKIDEVERDIRERCEEKLRDYFAELCQSEHVDFLRYEQMNLKISLADAKSKNANKAREQIAMFVTGVSEAMHSIETMVDADEIMAEYKQCLSLPRAIEAIKKRHEDLDAAIEDMRRRKAAEQEDAAASAKVEAIAPPVPVPPPAALEPEEPKVYRCTFTVRATKEQLKKLKEFLMTEGITYEH